MTALIIAAAFIAAVSFGLQKAFGDKCEVDNAYRYQWNEYQKRKYGKR